MEDPYVDSRGVLKNKLNIHNNTELQKSEANIVYGKMLDVDSVYQGHLDADLFKDIHKHLFGDIYSWAGEYREVPIEKEELVIPGLSVDYSYPTNIDKDLKKAIADLDSVDWEELKKTPTLPVTFARKIALIWKVHPFREGNTRTTMTFANMYAREHGFPFNLNVMWNRMTRAYDETGKKVIRYSLRDMLVLASLKYEYMPEPQFFGAIINSALLNKDNEKTQETKNEDDIDR